MELHYTRLDYGTYDMRIEWWNPDTGDDHHLDMEHSQDRHGMVQLLFGCIVLNKPKRVSIFIDGSKDPIDLNYQTIRDIIAGGRTPPEFTFGHSQYTPYHRMREAMSRWFVLRPMPGQPDMYECPACGRGARLEGHLHCEKCGLSFACKAQYYGVSADLLDSLMTNPDREVYYIDRPWNDNPPWMTREKLTEALGTYQDAVQAFTET